MKLFKKSKASDESYWKSFTDIMAGLLLIILLILMLLLLYMTQMNREEHLNDEEFPTEYYNDRDVSHNESDHYSDHYYDYLYDRPPTDGGGGGGGGEGVDDPGVGLYNDVGHDKTAVFVTVVDEETENVIKKAGILFELYANKNSSGGLQALHTYYPYKVEYKQYETTEDGTFYLPEKISNGWYSLHNLKAPKGYGFAEDVNFEITESLDWPEPFMVKVPMSPSKSIIYVHDVDAETKRSVAGTVYEVYAREDVVTLDGTLRYKKGEKVDEFTCDENGKGASIKLYYGEYTVTQKEAALYYAASDTPLDVTLEYTETEAPTYEIECNRTKAVLTLTDDQTGEPVAGAVYQVTGREDVTTDENGTVVLSDLDKGSTYELTLVSLPEPYRMKSKTVSFTVDEKGRINGEALSEIDHTAYIIRLTASVTDMLFGNEISTTKIRVYDSSNTLVNEWEGTGTTYEIENLEPGTYTLEAGGRKSSRESIELRDQGGVQLVATKYWTLWDTIAVVGAALLLGLIAALIVSLLRRRRGDKDE